MNDVNAYQVNRKAAEQNFKITLDGYEELCAAADAPDGLLQKMAGVGANPQQELSTAFAAGFICGRLVAVGKKEQALAWVQKAHAKQFSVADLW